MVRDLGFARDEKRILRGLRTPVAIQDFLDTIPMSFEEVHRSPRRVLRDRLAHCFDGALFAAAALWAHGERPLLLDLQSAEGDDDHVVALFRRHGRWGAISKTNHAVLRYREPMYTTVRELAASYFHEYFLDDGKKTLRRYSRPFDCARWKEDWVTTEDDLCDLAEALDASPHFSLLDRRMIAGLRSADAIEITAGQHVEWERRRKHGRAAR